MSFDLWDAATGGAQIGATQAVNPVTVNSGLFTVVLNSGGQFGANAFNGQARFLETAVQCPGDASLITLPRQQITASPYALTALTAISAQSATNAQNAQTAQTAQTALSANAIQGKAVSNAAPASGQVLTWNGSSWVPAAIPSNAPDWSGITNIPAGFVDGIDNEGWELDGNAGTTPASRLGTTDFMTMTFVMSNTTALRLVGYPGTPFVEFQPNILGGSFANTIGPNVQGSVIAGGGRSFNAFAPNAIYDSQGAILGGIDNEVGVNDGNPDNQSASVVAGGFSNEAMSDFVFIGGGRQNQVSGSHGVVGGGQNNVVQSTSRYGVVPGGFAASSTQFGQFAHAGGRFNNDGDAQSSVFVLRNVTNNTSARTLYLDCSESINGNTTLGTGTPCTSGAQLSIPNGRAMAFQLSVVARAVTGAGTLTTNSTAAYFVSGLLRNNAGTLTLTLNGSASEVGDAAATAALSLSLSADDTNDVLVINGASTQGGIVRWVARIEAVEVAN